MSRAPRIDTLRNQLAAARGLLDDASSALETLHSLAYERDRVDDLDARVTRARPDGYDNLAGSPRARSAYMLLGREVFAACGQLGGAARKALQIVNSSDEAGDNRRAPVTVPALEHLELLDAQARRVAAGEFNPGRAVGQPKFAAADKSAVRTIRRLEGELKAAERTRQREARNLEAQLRRRERTIELRDARIAELESQLSPS